MDETVIAIDPGRDKCGLAVVHRTRGVLEQQVVKTSEAVQKVDGLIQKYSLAKIILGNSTYSKTLKNKLEAIQGPRPPDVILVNEYRSTDEGRALYWRQNPPRGLRRLIPVSMQVPPVPVDDYAAVILAERYFKNKD